jgi:sulfur transfer complex TusBCD TusB component (DsrH family)
VDDRKEKMDLSARMLNDYDVVLLNQESIHFVLAQKSQGLISTILEF